MPLDDEARAQVVREWMRSTQTQTEFCVERGISTRVLREWARRLGATVRPEARARAIIDDAIAQLQALRAALGAEAACQGGGPDEDRGEAKERPEERHAAPEAPATPPPAATVAEPVRPRPMPAPGFLWY